MGNRSADGLLIKLLECGGAVDGNNPGPVAERFTLGRWGAPREIISQVISSLPLLLVNPC